MSTSNAEGNYVTLIALNRANIQYKILTKETKEIQKLVKLNAAHESVELDREILEKMNSLKNRLNLLNNLLIYASIDSHFTTDFLKLVDQLDELDKEHQKVDVS